MSREAEAFVGQVAAWARAEPRVVALALAGSHARGEAVQGSDIDVLILGDAESLLADTSWIGSFGTAITITQEDYGQVTSLRTYYAGGLEAEFGLASPAWAELPLDPGSAEVIAGGFRVLYDPLALLDSTVSGSQS